MTGKYDVPLFSRNEVYEACAAVARANPYDGRTRAGRAWSDAAWNVCHFFGEPHPERDLPPAVSSQEETKEGETDG